MEQNYRLTAVVSNLQVNRESISAIGSDGFINDAHVSYITVVLT